MIRQFDLFINPSLRTRDEAPYVVVLQSHFAGDLRGEEDALRRALDRLFTGF